MNQRICVLRLLSRFEKCVHFFIFNRLTKRANYLLLPQGQDKFFFVLPYEKMDACIYGELHGIPPEEVAEVIGLRVGCYFLLWENTLLYAGVSANTFELIFIA